MRRLFLLLVVVLAGCATLPDPATRTPSRAITDTAKTALGAAVRQQLAAHPGNSGFLPVPNGVDALLWRVALAAAAERSLDVQYYIWHDDLTGRLFADALLRAADRGVRVRVLIDDVGTSPDDSQLAALDTHPNIEIRIFNPVASRSARGLGMLSDFSRVNRRMHNKLLVVDHQVAMLGGRNIGDEYFAASGEVAFSDLDVVTFGPVIGDASAAFDRYWNAPASFEIAALVSQAIAPDRLPELRNQLAIFIDKNKDSPYVTGATERLVASLTQPSGKFFFGRTHLLVDDPDKVGRPEDDTTGTLARQLATAGPAPTRELIVISPYFIPGNQGVATLKKLVDSGVRVRVLTNSLAATDVAAVFSGYQRYRMALLDAGVELHEARPRIFDPEKRAHDSRVTSSRASLHAKTFLIDRRQVFIGSLNLDPRSIRLNTEIGVICEHPAMVDGMAKGLEALLDNIAWRVEKVRDEKGVTTLRWTQRDGDQLTRYDSDPEASLLRRWSSDLLQLLPIESQL